MRERADVPFEFCGCVELRQMLGLRADDEKELADFLEQVPVDSVYYHTHGFVLRHTFSAELYSNDFATWAAIEVRDRVLGERLALVDPLDFEDLEDLRAEIISIIDDHLKKLIIVPRVVYGQPFNFIESRFVRVPTGIEVFTLEEFRKALSEVDDRAIYYCMVEAPVRLKHTRNDFSAWLEEHLNLPGLAAKVQGLDPYIGGLELVRWQILVYCDEVLTTRRDL